MNLWCRSKISFKHLCSTCKGHHTLSGYNVFTEAIVQILGLDEAEGKAYAITSKEGEGPGTDPAKWKALLT